MNEQGLKEALKARLGSTEAASEAVEVIFDVIIREVAEGRKVGILGFGTFERHKYSGISFSVGSDASSFQPEFTASDIFREVVADPSRLPELKGKKAAATKNKTAKETAKGTAKQTDQPKPHRPKGPVKSGPKRPVRSSGFSAHTTTKAGSTVKKSRT